MMGIKKKKKRIPFVLSLIAIMLLTGVHFAYAVEGVRMPDLERDTSSLAVLVQYTDEDVTEPIQGMELTIFKVADMTVGNGNVNYTATKTFEPAGVDYNNLTTEKSIMAAFDLFEIVESNNLTGEKAVSGPNGEAAFGEVPNGMYLVVNTAASGNAENFSAINPYIVMVPQPLTELGENDWKYDVVSLPKMELGKFEYPPPEREEEEQPEYQPPKEEETEEEVEEVPEEKEVEVKSVVKRVTERVRSVVKTGDANVIAAWVGMLVVAVLVIVLLIRRRRRDQ